jgi:O-antigen/teichoic acid export membrane protein
MARNFGHLLWGQVGTTALGIFLTAMLGRWLSAADYGDYSVFLSNWMLAFVVVDWGQQQFLMREVARQHDRAQELLGGALTIRVVGGLFATVAVGGVTWFLYTPRTCLLGVLALLTMIPFFLAQGYGVAFKGWERMENDALLQVLNKAGTLAVTVGALLLGWALPGAIAAQVVAGLLTLVVAVELGRRTGLTPRRPTARLIRELLVGGTPIVAMYLASDAQRTIDINVVKGLVPADVVGWFGAAKNLLGTLIAPAIVMGGASFPRLSRAATDRAQFRDELAAAMRPVLLMAGYAAVGTYLCADLAVDVFYGGGRYDPAGVILQVSAPSFFLFFVDVLLGAAIVAAGRSAAMAVAKVVNVATSTALDLWLIPVFQARYGNGGIGAAIAYGASEIIMFAAALLIIPRGSMGRAFVLDLGRALVASGGAVASVYLLWPRWAATPATQSSWAVTLPALAIGTVVFAGLAWALRLVKRSDLQMLSALIRRKA